MYYLCCTCILYKIWFGIAFFFFKKSTVPTSIYKQCHQTCSGKCFPGCYCWKLMLPDANFCNASPFVSSGQERGGLLQAWRVREDLPVTWRLHQHRLCPARPGPLAHRSREDQDRKNFRVLSGNRNMFSTRWRQIKKPKQCSAPRSQANN